MLRFWILGIRPYFHAFALADYPTNPRSPRDQLLTICCCSWWADGASDAWEQKERLKNPREHLK
jgi:hypothetical protein